MKTALTVIYSIVMMFSLCMLFLATSVYGSSRGKDTPKAKEQKQSAIGCTMVCVLLALSALFIRSLVVW